MDISAMDPQGIQQLFDAEVFGPEGESIGTVEQIFADDVTGAPTFVTVRDAATGTENFLPVGGASYDDKHVTVPFSKDVVEAAPAATGGDDLSPDRESDVYRYYGIRAPRRPRAEEPSPDWGQDVETGSAQAEGANQAEEAVQSGGVAQAEEAARATSAPPAAELAGEAEQPEAGEPVQETVPDDATAATSLSQDEPQFDPVPEGMDAGGPDEFRSIEETEEQQDAAAPEPGVDQTPVDELPAEETAVIEGGSFPFAATTAGAAAAGAAAGTAVAGAAGSQQDDEAEDAAADEEAMAAGDQGFEEPVEEGEDALATPRADGETPEAAREDEAGTEEGAEKDGAAESTDEEPTADEGTAPDEEKPAEEGSPAAVAVPGLPEGAVLRKYTVTEMVTVQIPVTREVVCWQDADGGLHELDAVPAPEATPDAPSTDVPSEGVETPATDAETRGRDAADPANWWFEKSEETEQEEPPQS